MNVLEINNLSKHFGGVYAVNNFAMSLESGNIVAIIGPNGAGKTTIFNIISGIYKPDGGHIKLNGIDITGKEQYEITKLGIARTFQNIRLFKGLSVIENIMTASDPYSKYGFFESIFNIGKKKSEEKKIREKNLYYLDIVGLSNYRDEKPENLPYGLQRKLEIARAMATNPKVLLLDEPAAGLNPSEIEDFNNLIEKLHDDYKLSILLIEHRMEVVMELSEKIYVVSFGKKIAEGLPNEILNNKEVMKAYIGEED